MDAVELDQQTLGMGTWGVSKHEIECVFSLGGGELGVGSQCHDVWAGRAYWYDEQPNYVSLADAEGKAAELMGACGEDEAFEIRTAIECRLYGSDSEPADAGWIELFTFSSSGETVDEFEDENGVEVRDVIYIGDGWVEAVYARKITY